MQKSWLAMRTMRKRKENIQTTSLTPKKDLPTNSDANNNATTYRPDSKIGAKKASWFGTLRLRTRRCGRAYSLKEIASQYPLKKDSAFKLKGIAKSHSMNETDRPTGKIAHTGCTPEHSQPVTLGNGRPWIRGVAFAPDHDFCVLDSNNDLIMRYVRDALRSKYSMANRKKLAWKPRDIAYIRCYLYNYSFTGFIVTLESKLLAYITPKDLQVAKIFQTPGNYSGVRPIPQSNLLIVVNSVTSSVDIINVCGTPLHSYRMPADIDFANGYLALALVNSNPVVILSASSGLICISLEWKRHSKSRAPIDLILKSVQRYVPRMNDKFQPEGVSVAGDQVFVANYSGNSIVRFKLLHLRHDRGRVSLSRVCEHPCLEPLCIDVLLQDDKSVELGIGRLMGEAPNFNLLKFVTTSLDPSYGKCPLTPARDYDTESVNHKWSNYAESFAKF